jgi:hypothetical protein
MKPPNWTKAEEELLASLAGEMPFSIATKVYMAQASSRGFPKRTRVALEVRAKIIGVHRTSTGEWLSTGDIAKALDVSIQTIVRWVDDKGLKARIIKKKRWIKRCDLRGFARQYPALFGGLSEPQLIQLLDQEGIAKWLAEKNLPLRRISLPVFCVETGKKFRSIKEAARFAHVTRQRMADAIKYQQYANGKHYRMLRPELVAATKALPNVS